MKTYIKTIFICIFMSALCTPVHAQWEKKAAGMIVGKVPVKPAVNLPKEPLLYKWPKVQYNQIQSAFHGQNASLANFSKQLVDSPRQSLSISTPVTYVDLNRLTSAVDRAIATRELRADKLAIVRSTAETEALALLHQEQLHYTDEIAAAQSLRREFLQISELTPQNTAQLQNGVNELNSNTLREYLTASLQTGDMVSFYRDLTDYYVLDGNPVQAAYNYSLRHPHKPNLWMRRLMRSPLIDKSLQQQAGALLHKDYSTEKERQNLLTTLRYMQSEYEISLRAIYASEGVYSKLAFYRQTTQALADFIAAHGRRPKRNTADEKEFELLRDIGFALEVTTAAQEEPFAGELKKLRDLWDANEPTFWSLDKTLSVLERFLQKTGPRFPRSLKENPNLPDQEVALYDNLEYWLHKQPILHSTIISLQNKYRP